MTEEKNNTTLHGVFLDVLGLGILLTGSPGIGKSELALGLIDRGHRLITDDSVELTRSNDKSIIGRAPALLKDYLEVRGLGVLNIRVMFGDTAIKDEKRLQLIIHILDINDHRFSHLDRLKGMHREANILGISIPEVTIPVAPGRNLAILVEGAVRNHILKSTGYNASEEFIHKQEILMEQESQ